MACLMHLLLWLLRAALACPLGEPDPGALDRWIVDPSRLWPEHEKAILHQEILALRQQGGPQLLVMLDSTLEGDAAPCAAALAQQWGQAQGRVVLLLVQDPAQRVARAAGPGTEPWTAQALDALVSQELGESPDPQRAAALARALLVPPEPAPAPSHRRFFVQALGLAALFTLGSRFLGPRAAPPPAAPAS